MLRDTGLSLSGGSWSNSCIRSCNLSQLKIHLIKGVFKILLSGSRLNLETNLGILLGDEEDRAGIFSAQQCPIQSLGMVWTFTLEE